jgi:hypothetical protein
VRVMGQEHQQPERRLRDAVDLSERAFHQFVAHDQPPACRVAAPTCRVPVVRWVPESLSLAAMASRLPPVWGPRWFPASPITAAKLRLATCSRGDPRQPVGLGAFHLREPCLKR